PPAGLVGRCYYGQNGVLVFQEDFKRRDGELGCPHEYDSGRAR
ncbi:MAG: hypothetical protein HW407_929, partial [Bacteroidetes bacterium]|nr:hypothetical protein [Bacteroidota bacterium]